MRVAIASIVVLFQFFAAQAQADKIKYFHTDILGNVVVITDENGNVIERRAHEPYGLPQPPIDDGPGYTGHVHDGASGHIYMQQRYYDPVIGRFLSPDPMAVDPTTAWNFNRYNYAANNPFKFVDRDGREAGFAYLPDGSMRHFYNDHEPDPSLAYAAMDLTPGLGDIKGFVDAYNDPSPYAIIGAIVGVVPVVGDLGTALIKGAGDLIASAGKLERLKGGVLQGHVQGDPNAIFQSITDGGRQIEGGRFEMEDGSIIGMHVSKTTGVSTIDINTNGKEFKIRIHEEGR